MLDVMDPWSLKPWLNFWKGIILWLKITTNWLMNNICLKKIQAWFHLILGSSFLLSSLLFSFVNICLVLEFWLCCFLGTFIVLDLKIEYHLMLQCRVFLYFTFATISYYEMGWIMNGHMVFNGGWIRVGNYGSFVNLVSFVQLIVL